MSNAFAPALIALLLAGCDRKPPVCEPGSEVKVRASRWIADDACFLEGTIPGQCEDWSDFLEDDGFYEGPCDERTLMLTEAATGDCLRVFPLCNDNLTDPRYLDCSASTNPDCCRAEDFATCIVTPGQ